MVTIKNMIPSYETCLRVPVLQTAMGLGEIVVAAAKITVIGTVTAVVFADLQANKFFHSNAKLMAEKLSDKKPLNEHREQIEKDFADCQTELAQANQDLVYGIGHAIPLAMTIKFIVAAVKGFLEARAKANAERKQQLDKCISELKGYQKEFEEMSDQIHTNEGPLWVKIDQNNEEKKINEKKNEQKDRSTDQASTPPNENEKAELALGQSRMDRRQKAKSGSVDVSKFQPNEHMKPIASTAKKKPVSTDGWDFNESIFAELKD